MAPPFCASGDKIDEVAQILFCMFVENKQTYVIYTQMWPDLHAKRLIQHPGIFRLSPSIYIQTVKYYHFSSALGGPVPMPVRRADTMNRGVEL